MIDTIHGIIFSSSVMLAAGMVFSPVKGLFTKNKKSKQDIQRIQIEDTLKYLHDCEYNNTTAAAEGVASYLSISSGNAIKLLEKLEKMKLVAAEDSRYTLTTEGRSYALRVIRIHRLLEKYLADETGLEESLWHKEAEDREHFISPEDAEILAAKMGNPVFDPHGDPIPTAQGEIPEQKGFSLTAAKAGDIVQITHIEDEPIEVYAQITAEGLYPGMYIRVLEVSGERIIFEANGEEVKLAPVIASGITVKSANDKNVKIKKYRTLASLKQGESAAVVGISKACRGQQRRRLMDLGVVPGSVITAELVSSGGNPVAYKIRDALIALRTQHAEYIFVKDAEAENE
jgi:DtxR family Mn-dependent transcriptional regulator